MAHKRKKKVYLRESFGELIVEGDEGMIAEGRVMSGENPFEEARTLKTLVESMGYKVVDETGLTKMTPKEMAVAY